MMKCEDKNCNGVVVTVIKSDRIDFVCEECGKKQGVIDFSVKNKEDGRHV